MLHRIWIPAPLLVFAVVVSIAEAETFGAVARGTERDVGEHVAVGAVSCACVPPHVQPCDVGVPRDCDVGGT